MQKGKGRGKINARTLLTRLRCARHPLSTFGGKRGGKINELLIPLCACAERVASAAKSGESIVRIVGITTKKATPFTGVAPFRFKIDCFLQSIIVVTVFVIHVIAV
jgi:hypothetical protein